MLKEDEGAIAALTSAAASVLENTVAISRNLGPQRETYLPILHAIKAK